MKKLNFIFAFYLSFFASPAFSMYENVDFDQIREEGGFEGHCLSKVATIFPSEETLEAEEIDALFNSPHAANIKTLNLRGQILVNDLKVAQLCNNRAFARIINLDLRDTGITLAALDSILESNTLGSIRDLPQMSGRYGCPSSTIYVSTNLVDLTPDIIGQYNRGNRKKNDFTIYYKHPANGIATAPTVTGIKMLEISNQ